MKKLSTRISKMENKLLPRPPKVICANSDADAKKQLAGLKKQYGELQSPIVLIAPTIEKD